jgi:hypothetical protein
MQPLSDKQRIDRLETNMEKLEKKVDDGFAETRMEFRAVRAELGAVSQSLHAMWLTMILGFAGIVIAMLAHV